MAAILIAGDRDNFSFIWIPISLYGAMLDQSLFPHFISGWGKARNSVILKLTWIMWYFAMTFIVNQGYKSDMFSCLTKAPNPAYPNTLEDLSRTDLKIFTYSGMNHLGHAKASAKVHIEETISSATHQRTTYPNYFEKFDKQLVWHKHWLHGLRSFVAMHYAQVHAHLLPQKAYGWNQIPDEYAVFEPLKHTRMQKQVVNLFLPEKFVSPVIRVDKFVTTMPWTVNKGFFYPLFKRALGQIFESGLYARWDGFHDDINGVDNFHAVSGHFHSWKMNMSTIELPVRKQLWNGYYFANKFRVNTDLNEVALVSAYTLKVVWFLTFLLLGIATVVFVYELLSGCKQKRMKVHNMI